MARGSQTFEFDHVIFDRIPILIVAHVRAGKVYEITPYFEGDKINFDKHSYNADYDYIDLDGYFKEWAQAYYDLRGSEIFIK